MLLPTFKRLLSSDFQKEWQKLVDQLSLSLNNGISVLYTALNNNITIRDNIRGTVVDVLVRVDSTGKPTETTAFKLNSTAQVDILMVGLALNQTNSNIYPTSGIIITGVQSSNIYTIQNVTGLTPNDQWLLRVVAFQK